MIAFFANILVLVAVCRLYLDDEENTEAQPAMIMKLAAPKSIQPYPLTSVLQKVLGKILKSTANIAIVVKMYTHDLCIVRNTGRCLLLLYWDDLDVVCLVLNVDCGINNANNNLIICIPNNKNIGLNSEV